MKPEKTNLVHEYEIDKIKEEMKKGGYWFLRDDKEVRGRDVPEEIKANLVDKQ